MRKTPFNSPVAHSLLREKGAATLMSVILMLLTMTILALYGTKVGFFEQTAAANNARQKQAFHAAEAGINIVVEHFRADTEILLSSDENGWFNANSLHWLSCAGSDYSTKTHPCFSQKNNSFYYVEDATVNAADLVRTIALRADDVLPDDQNVEVSAALCVLDVDYSVEPAIVSPNCAATPGNEMLITLVSRGTSDNGRGKALVKQVFADYDIAAGVPGVALTAPFVGLPNGTADIVANPNGGGEGVPLSVWSASELEINGALRTCEAYEFYDQYSLPDDISCPGCDCAKDAELSSKFKRYSDIHDEDPNFPIDLFEYFFGVPKVEYEAIKNSMTNINSCDDLSGESNGAYWVSGDCAIQGGGCALGTQDRPVLLTVSGDFRANGCEIYGMIFVTDAEHLGEEMVVAMNGGATVYGAVMVDHNMQQANGSMAIVYNEDVLKKASTFSGVAAIPGGWSDFL